MRPLRPFAALVVLVTALMAVPVLVPPAAGAVEVVDREQLAKRVKAVVKAAHPDLPVTKVTCRPSTIERRRGAKATCTVIAGTYALKMLVTVANKRGTVTIASTQAMIPKANAEYLVTLNATLPVTADCGPDAYIVRKPGESFTCTATFADGTQSLVTVTPTDVAGNATITAAT